MKHVATHTFKAYARSLDLTILEAMRKSWCGFTGNKEPTVTENKRILDDVAIYHGQGILPIYAVRWLEHERRRQMQDLARESMC